MRPPDRNRRPPVRPARPSKGRATARPRVARPTARPPVRGSRADRPSEGRATARPRPPVRAPVRPRVAQPPVRGSRNRQPDRHRLPSEARDRKTYGRGCRGLSRLSTGRPTVGAVVPRKRLNMPIESNSASLRLKDLLSGCRNVCSEQSSSGLSGAVQSVIRLSARVSWRRS